MALHSDVGRVQLEVDRPQRDLSRVASTLRCDRQIAIAKVASIAVAVLLAAATLAAQPPPPPSAVAATRTVWDGAYSAAQAVRGHDSYAASCSRCHALDADGIPRRFTGDKFWAAWGEATLDRLYGYLRRSMPNDAPGALTEATYADIVAFLLRSNGVPPSAAELTPATIPSIRLTQRGGDGGLPEGAFVAVSGCLVKSIDGWTVAQATAPRRPPKAEETAAAETIEPLGTAAFRLLYLISPIDKLEGHRVSVRGLLVRRPADAVNVMTVQSVSPSCE
jgi:cytochrome c5